jgi:hypothetical protein
MEIGGNLLAGQSDRIAVAGQLEAAKTLGDVDSGSVETADFSG